MRSLGNATLLAVRTHVITPADDLLQVIRTYAGKRLQKGDILAISSKVVAITQGRLVRPDSLHPSWAARAMARFIDQNGSLSSPFAMQAVIREQGVLRMGLAFLAGGLSRLVLRRKGDFYRIGGLPARAIDDVTGNMPPFDKHIILSPAHAQTVAEKVQAEFGVDCAIVDANDLGKAEILGATAGVPQAEVLAIFRKNPWGNADERTPLMILRPSALRPARPAAG